jgi:hypothetical protein
MWRRALYKITNNKIIINESKDESKDEFIGSDALFPKGLLNSPPLKVLKKQKISSSYDVRVICPVSANELNNLLQGKLKNKGEYIIELSKKYKICPLFLAAVCCHESNNGQSLFAQKYNNVAGQMHLDKSSGKWAPIKFSSVNECLDRTTANLKENYINRGIVTISKIQSKYCPIITNKKSKDYNDPRGVNKYWTSGIQKWMNKV